ncbi:MAG TPA: phosphoribosylformylglycinamidine cyclo-ligase [Fimbriimonadaceae bacterium]|nr:phosphoribosylformylglycinamidine cyclo-ligase [Fimbriimonadaceae bacterium]
MPNEPLTYRSAGVNIDEAQRALRAVTRAVQTTHTSDVVGGIGGFGGLFRANFGDLNSPTLVSSIDGIGTKTKIAAMMGEFTGLGRDIVNHCVNDILCQGAKPLFFLDYYGCSKLSGLVFEEILHGMAEACRDADCALIGGETAEMPGVYGDDEIDVVGTVVGIVDLDRKLPRGKMQAGDAIIGIASDGLHTNGYSLARSALFEKGSLSVRDKMPGLNTTIGDELIRPHRSYFRSVYPLIQDVEGLYAVAHVTGGGLYDNLPRVMPSDVKAVIEKRSWTPLPIFQLIQGTGDIPDQEMYRAFNMGIGMVLFVNRLAASGVVQRLNQAGESAAIIGEVQSGSQDVQIL